MDKISKFLQGLRFSLRYSFHHHTECFHPMLWCMFDMKRMLFYLVNIFLVVHNTMPLQVMVLIHSIVQKDLLLYTKDKINNSHHILQSSLLYMNPIHTWCYYPMV